MGVITLLDLLKEFVEFLERSQVILKNRKNVVESLKQTVFSSRATSKVFNYFNVLFQTILIAERIINKGIRFVSASHSGHDPIQWTVSLS